MELVTELLGLICHQDPTRSFEWSRRVAPLCARCLGLYAGLLLGWVGASLRPPRSRVRRAALPLALLTGADAVLGPGAGPGGNLWRAATGLASGAACGLLLQVGFGAWRSLPQLSRRERKEQVHAK